ncbi:MAG: VOC family protein [Acidobacteriota bacterium]
MDYSLVKRVDHLVYSTMDLEKSVTDLEGGLGARAAPGGRHPGRGTRNALLALSASAYLEIVGPEAGADAPRWFAVDTLTAPRLFTWAVKGTDLVRFADEANRDGVRLGAVVSGSRQGSDGRLLRWQFTDPATVVADGLVPFFIDWGDSPHPSVTAPRGPTLVSLRGEHPEPKEVARALAVVGVDLPIKRGPRILLIATLRTEMGVIELQ